MHGPGRHCMDQISPELLLRAYACGYFPMADSADSDDLYWYDPPWRGVIPLDRFHVPKKLRRVVRQGRFEIRFDTAFQAVLDACAEPTDVRPKTWINDGIRRLYRALAETGHAHSVECWRDDQLTGGLYGVSLRGAFFGESMFSREADASKVALVHLVAQLRACGFSLLDTQFMTDHLRQFGGLEISQAAYKKRLGQALAEAARFEPDPEAVGRLLDGLDRAPEAARSFG